METTEIRNVSPAESVRDLVRSGKVSGNNLFVLAGYYEGDVSVSLGGRDLTFLRVEIKSLSQAFMRLAFWVAFYNISERETSVPSASPVNTHVKTDGQRLTLSVFCVSDGVVILDGKPLSGREKAVIETDLGTFCRTAGHLFAQMLELLDEKFDGIDGINEYFGTISFSEGFQEFWADD